MATKNRKPLETIRAYLEGGMSLTDCSKICQYPVPALSILAKAWDIRMPMGRPKGCKRVGAQMNKTTTELPSVGSVQNTSGVGHFPNSTLPQIFFRHGKAASTTETVK